MVLKKNYYLWVYSTYIEESYYNEDYTRHKHNDLIKLTGSHWYRPNVTYVLLF